MCEMECKSNVSILFTMPPGTRKFEVYFIEIMIDCLHNLQYLRKIHPYRICCIQSKINSSQFSYYN